MLGRKGRRNLNIVLIQDKIFIAILVNLLAFKFELKFFDHFHVLN